MNGKSGTQRVGELVAHHLTLNLTSIAQLVPLSLGDTITALSMNLATALRTSIGDTPIDPALFARFCLLVERCLCAELMRTCPERLTPELLEQMRKWEAEAAAADPLSGKPMGNA